jgi:uncharacterized protein
MEGNLLKAVWEKLIEALRFRSAHIPRASIDQPANRMKEEFSVLSRGVTIKGRIFFPGSKPAMLYPALIICHGIPGSGAARPADDPGYEKLAEDFASDGIAAVFFNFRGCGESGGDFDMMGWTWDLEAVLDRVLNTPHIDPTRVMVLGFSGGGAAAVRVAAEATGIYSLAIVGTPANFEIFEASPDEIIKDFRKRGIVRSADFPKDLDKWVTGFKEIEPSKWVSQFRGKHLLIVHGDADELIPLEHARQLFEHAPAGVAELEVIPGGVHRLRLDPRCEAVLRRFFLKSLGWSD